MTYENTSKCDRVGAEMLARVGRLDPKLLVRSVTVEPSAQADRAILTGRDALVSSRTQLICHV